MMERRDTAQELESTLYRAYVIGEMAVIYGDPNLINTRFDKIQSVGKEDIERVAKTYLTEAQSHRGDHAAQTQGRDRESRQLGAPHEIPIPNL